VRRTKYSVAELQWLSTIPMLSRRQHDFDDCHAERSEASLWTAVHFLVSARFLSEQAEALACVGPDALVRGMTSKARL